MRIEEKQNYLSEYLRLNQAVDKDLEKLFRLRSESVSASAVKFGERVVNRKSVSSLEEIVEKIVIMQNNINNMIDKMVDMRMCIEKATALLEDRRERLVIMFKYIDGKSFSEIDKMLDMSRGMAKRISKKALEKLELE